MAALVAGLAFGACDESAFRCADDMDCEGAGPGAFCQALHYCAVEDADCPSGAAFAEASGPYGSMCVPLDAGDDAGHDPIPAPQPDPDEPPPHRAGPDPDPPPVDGVLIDLPCYDGKLDGDETDTDCGGQCGPCATCEACLSDDDCGSGDTCIEGECRQTTIMIVDWMKNCAASSAGLTYSTVDLPAGDYVVRAMPSAGAKWSWESAWSWFTDECQGMDLSPMRPLIPQWSATPLEAYESIATPILQRTHHGGEVSCGLIDSICGDNLGGTVLSFERQCP